MQFIVKEFSWARNPSILQECLFFAFLVCHEAGIWNIDTCIEVVLSKVEL